MSITGRILTIIHLCLAFWFLTWALLQPWTGEHFAKRSLQSLYEYVLQDPHFEEFAQLEKEEAASIQEGYRELMNWKGTPVKTLIVRGVWLLTSASSLYASLWLWISLVICVCLLFSIRGAAQAVWILPLITLLFSVENQQSGVQQYPPDAALFPSEQYLQTHYMDASFGSSLLAQQEQLQAALNRYYAKEWSSTGDPEAGVYRFQVARLQKWKAVPLAEISPLPVRERLGFEWIVFYCLWNTVFAAGIAFAERNGPIRALA